MFTASLSSYANPIFQRLDPSGSLIDFVLFRESCTFVSNEYYVKDLARLGRRLEDLIIIDNSPASYLFQPQNALPCTSWYINKNDDELKRMIPILIKISDLPSNIDIRDIL